MPVPVQNLVDGPTTFSDPTKNVAIEWQARDHINGEDVQIVPDEIVATAPFQKALRNGVFARLDGVEEDTESEQANLAFARQTAANAKREADYSAANSAVIDQAPQNDILTVACIGPNNRGNGTCGNPAPFKESARNETPPLCSTHKNLASEFIPTESDTLVDGKPTVTWQRMGLAPRERQQ